MTLIKEFEVMDEESRYSSVLRTSEDIGDDNDDGECSNTFMNRTITEFDYMYEGIERQHYSHEQSCVVGVRMLDWSQDGSKEMEEVYVILVHLQTWCLSLKFWAWDPYKTLCFIVK